MPPSPSHSQMSLSDLGDDDILGHWSNMVPSLVARSDIVALVIVRAIHPPRYGTADGTQPTRDPDSRPTPGGGPTDENSQWQTFRVEVEHYFKTPDTSVTELFIDEWVATDGILIPDSPTQPFRVDHILEHDQAIIFAHVGAESSSPVASWLSGEIAERRRTGRVVGYSSGADIMLLLGPHVFQGGFRWPYMANRYFNAIEYVLGSATPMPTETAWRNPYITATSTATAEAPAPTPSPSQHATAAPAPGSP